MRLYTLGVKFKVAFKIEATPPHFLLTLPGLSKPVAINASPSNVFDVDHQTIAHNQLQGAFDFDRSGNLIIKITDLDGGKITTIQIEQEEPPERARIITHEICTQSNFKIARLKVGGDDTNNLLTCLEHIFKGK